MEIKIRSAKEKDVKDIFDIGNCTEELGFSKKYPFHERLEIKEFIKNNKENIVLVAENENRIIGFCFAKIMARAAGGWCMLDNLAVLKEHRENGAGTLLLNELNKILKKRNVKYIQILEEIHHKKTRDFWKKRGYKETKNFLWAEKRIK